MGQLEGIPNCDSSLLHAMVTKPALQTIEEWLGPLEQFVVLLYNYCTSDLDCVDEARKHLFTQKGRAIEGLPPTKDALI